LCAGVDDSVLVAFQFAPLVQKYNAGGQLEWECRLAGEAVEKLERSFWHVPGSRSYVRKSMDGVTLEGVITGVTITRRNNILVSLANKTIAVISRDGKQTDLLELEIDGFVFLQSIAISQQRLGGTAADQCLLSSAPLVL